MGRQLYKAVGSMSSRPGEKLQYICRLAEDNEPARFKRLSLSFGFSDVSRWRGEYSIRLFSNGNSLDAINISSGMSAPTPWVVNIPSSTKFLAVEVECVRSPSNYSCDKISVFDDTLE
ncbi:hypothetical protein QT971_19120 [Microcoleus sp. herbarium19]|uniref:hypothetical protein n=2 Tax=unclassified Microcoleus TaxID=2642155 RepID=UPI002FD3BE99